MKTCHVSEQWGLARIGKTPWLLQHYSHQWPGVDTTGTLQPPSQQNSVYRWSHICHGITLETQLPGEFVPWWEMSPSYPPCPANHFPKAQLSYRWSWSQSLSRWHSTVTVTMPHHPLCPCLANERNSVVISGFCRKQLKSQNAMPFKPI